MKVYFSKDKRQYIVKDKGSVIAKSKLHMIGHKYIAKSMNENIRFLFVLTLPELEFKVSALKLALQTFKPCNIGVLTSYPLINANNGAIKILSSLKLPIFVDSGAFHILCRKIPIEKYQSHIDNYINFVNENIDYISYCVVPDIPCDSRSKLHGMTNIQKIVLTIKNTIYFIDRICDSRKVISVVQGYEKNEYEYCLDKLKMYGLVTHILGIGSLCIRKYEKNQVENVLSILRIIKENAPT